MSERSGWKLRRNDFARSGGGFSAKTNPNLNLNPSTGESMRMPRGGQAEFPAKTNPNHGRAPLTDHQKELANRHLPLARSLAKQLHARWYVEREEVESVAFVALVEAARCFDPEQGAQFATFARYRIVGAILDFSKKAGRNRHLQSSTMRGLWGVEMEVEQYGTPVGISPDLPVGAELDAVDSVEFHFRPMSPSQARACRLIYLEGKSQEEAAEIMNCTASYVSKIHREAMKLLFERCQGRPDLARAAFRARQAETGHRDEDAWCPADPIRGRARMPRPRAFAKAC